MYEYDSLLGLHGVILRDSNPGRLTAEPSVEGLLRPSSTASTTAQLFVSVCLSYDTEMKEERLGGYL